MDNQTADNRFSSVSLFNTQTKNQEVYDKINKCLSQAEALAAVAGTIDFDLFAPEIVSNYLWTLSDIIHEGKILFDNLNK